MGAGQGPPSAWHLLLGQPQRPVPAVGLASHPCPGVTALWAHRGLISGRWKAGLTEPRLRTLESRAHQASSQDPGKQGSPSLVSGPWKAGLTKALSQDAGKLGSTRALAAGLVQHSCWPGRRLLWRVLAATSADASVDDLPAPAFPRCPCCVLETCCIQAHLVVSGRGLRGPRGRPGLGAVLSAGRPLHLCGARWPRELVSAPNGDFCTHHHVCSQLTWLEGLRFFVFLQFVFLSAQHFSWPGAPRAVCRALPWSGAWGQGARNSWNQRVDCGHFR